jgi:ubiquinone/menaquinone biosynthesis C-methylase UbiE
MNIIETIHSKFTYERRVTVLAKHLSSLLPPNARVLDVGCGDGLLALLIMQQRTDVTVEGIDILLRPKLHIIVREFDGNVIPHKSGSFDVVMFNDVLHHTDDPMVLLREATRVSKAFVLLKDHTRNGLFAKARLQFMDFVGNARHGVRLPYNYWSRDEWMDGFGSLKLRINEWRDDLGLYQAPANWIFGQSLHFVARLELT